MWLINKLRSRSAADSSESLVTRLLAVSFLFFFMKGMVWLTILAFTWVRFF